MFPNFKLCSLNIIWDGTTYTYIHTNKRTNDTSTRCPSKFALVKTSMVNMNNCT